MEQQRGRKKEDVCDEGGGSGGGGEGRGGGADECHTEPTCGPVCLAYLCAAAGLRVIPLLSGLGEDAAAATGQAFVYISFTSRLNVHGALFPPSVCYFQGKNEK